MAGQLTEPQAACSARGQEEPAAAGTAAVAGTENNSASILDSSGSTAGTLAKRGRQKQSPTALSDQQAAAAA